MRCAIDAAECGGKVARWNTTRSFCRTAMMAFAHKRELLRMDGFLVSVAYSYEVYFDIAKAA